MGPMDPLDELRAALPGDVVVTEADAMEKYRHDWSRDPSAGTPVAVVRARDAADVQAAVRRAAAGSRAGRARSTAASCSASSG